VRLIDCGGDGGKGFANVHDSVLPRS
jgi:hypothetical protein